MPKSRVKNVLNGFEKPLGIGRATLRGVEIVTIPLDEYSGLLAALGSAVAVCFVCSGFLCLFFRIELNIEFPIIMNSRLLFWRLAIPEIFGG